MRSADDGFAQLLMLVAEPLDVAREPRTQPAQRREVESVLEREMRLQRIGEAQEDGARGLGLPAVERGGNVQVEVVELAVLRRDRARSALHTQRQPRLLVSLAHVYSTTPS